MHVAMYKIYCDPQDILDLLSGLELTPSSPAGGALDNNNSAGGAAPSALLLDGLFASPALTQLAPPQGQPISSLIPSLQMVPL